MSNRQKVRLDQIVVPDPVADDGKVSTVVGGELVLAAPTGGAATAALVPLTTVVGGVPELVWEADNSLALTEVPL